MYRTLLRIHMRINVKIGFLFFFYFLKKLYDISYTI